MMSGIELTFEPPRRFLPRLRSASATVRATEGQGACLLPNLESRGVATVTLRKLLRLGPQLGSPSCCCLPDC
jgi:hypothetical protein